MKRNGVLRGWLTVTLVTLLMTLASAAAQAQVREVDEGSWYVTDAINEGLGAVPDAVNLRTPREAIRSFLDLTDSGDYAAAAHILNLSDLSPADQRERGAELARKLSEVLRRGEWLTSRSLSGRPDGATEQITKQSTQTSDPRRNIELASLSLGNDAYDIRLGRYRVGEADPVWLFMSDSIEPIPRLYTEYGPSAFEDFIPDRFKSTFGMLRIWEWIALPIVFLFIGLVGWAVYSLVGWLAKLLPSGSRSVFAGQVRVPLALIAMSLTTQTLLDYVVSFSAAATTTLRVILMGVLAWGIGTIALRVVDAVMLKMMRRLMGQIDDLKLKDDRRLLTSLYALRRVIILITVSVVSVYVLGQVQLFETLGLSILASASVLAVLVGVAGQAVLGNILSSFQLSLAKPIRIGDLVMFEGQWCYVEGIFYTFIRLRAWNERRIVVPVTYFASQPFENLSSKNVKEYRSLELSLHLNADVAVIRERFFAFAKEEESVIEHHKLLSYVTAQSGTSQTITCYLMTSDPLSGWAAQMSVLEKLMAFVRDNHPDWWPRDVMVISQEDITLGANQRNASGTNGAPTAEKGTQNREHGEQAFRHDNEDGATGNANQSGYDNAEESEDEQPPGPTSDEDRQDDEASEPRGESGGAPDWDDTDADESHKIAPSRRYAHETDAYDADEHGADEHGADEHGADEPGSDGRDADGRKTDETRRRGRRGAEDDKASDEDEEGRR
ncbi:mechanosensitive ion channel domain-containing protein [Salinicola aestuarinus]|uniref:mechanosensitive ion channel domain-containing protein n=1 Tax=Salinicola aestuarinus TaxID=1949082 RepID=UPI000DA22899